MGVQKNTPGNAFIGCLTIFLISIIFFSIVGSILRSAFYFEIVPFIMKYVIIFVLMTFGFITLVILFSVLFGKKSTGSEAQSQNYSDAVELNNVEQMKVNDAFRILGLTPNVSYTKVSERYYELTKKINQSKMNEERKKQVLEELNKAFEILTEYYSKNA
ncbi:hypothetical protein [Fervidobacterium sp.]